MIQGNSEKNLSQFSKTFHRSKKRERFIVRLSLNLTSLSTNYSFIYAFVCSTTELWKLDYKNYVLMTLHSKCNPSEADVMCQTSTIWVLAFFIGKRSGISSSYSLKIERSLFDTQSVKLSKTYLEIAWLASHFRQWLLLKFSLLQSLNMNFNFRFIRGRPSVSLWPLVFFSRHP